MQRNHKFFTKERESAAQSLSHLERLTEMLPAFPAACHEESGFKENIMDFGTSLSWNLQNEPAIAVARWFNSSGTSFPEHGHKEREWLIVYKGAMLLTRNGNDNATRLMPGDFAFIEAGELHRADFPEDCWYIAITIPASKDWPK